MKVLKLFLVVCVLSISIPAYAQLSVDDETYVKATYELEKLKQKRADLISERDDLLLQEDIKCNAAKDTIMGDYEVQIDEMESNINSKQSDIDTLISK